MDYDEQGAHLKADVKRLDFIAWVGLCRQVQSICVGRHCYKLFGVWTVDNINSTSYSISNSPCQTA